MVLEPFIVVVYHVEPDMFFDPFVTTMCVHIYIWLWKKFVHANDELDIYL